MLENPGFRVALCLPGMTISPCLQEFCKRPDEVDLLMDIGKKKVPFEMKLHSSPGAQAIEGLRRCMKDLNLKRGYVVYPGRENYSLGEGITALAAEEILFRPQEIERL